MKRLTPQHIIILAIAALTALAAMAKRPTAWEKEAAARKADYVFLEAVNRQLRGDEGGYYDLLRHAHEINPADDETANTYALYLIHLEQFDSLAVDRGLKMMKRYVDKNPDDLYSSINYALMAQSAGYDDEALRVYGLVHRLHPERIGITYRYAEMLSETMRESAIDSAMAIYDSLEASEGPSVMLTSARISPMFARGDTLNVLREARRLIDNNPKSPENNLFMGGVMMALNMPDSALTYYNNACELDSTNALSFYTRAGFYHQTGDSAAFDREIFRVLKMENLDFDVKMEVMRSYVRELYGDSIQQPRIIDLFNQMVKIHPHEAHLRNLYGIYLFMINDYSGAAEQQQLAMDLDPNFEQGWSTLEACYFGAGDNNAALREIKRGVDYFPTSAPLTAQMGAAYARMDSVTQAIRSFQRAIELTDSTDYKNLSNYNCWIGDVYYTAEKRDSAFIYYSKAIDLNPLNTLALNNYAYYLAVEGRDLDRALECIRRVINSEEPAPNWLDTYAWVLFRMKDYPNARIQIDKALELDESPGAEVLEHAGDIYFLDGEPAKAVEFWQRALEADPDNGLLKKKVKHKAYYYE